MYVFKFFFGIALGCMFFLGNNIDGKEQMPEPYGSLAVLPLDLFWGEKSWFASVNRESLEKIIIKKHPKIIIEIGSWLGNSTIFMASLLPTDGKLYAIDHWLGGPSQVHNPRILERLLFQQFLSNIIHSGFAYKVIPIRMDSLEAARALQVIADLIYVDGSHDPDDAYQDIMAYYPKLAPGGVMCGDDYVAVKRGVDRARAELNVRIKTKGSTYWEFE